MKSEEITQQIKALELQRDMAKIMEQGQLSQKLYDNAVFKHAVFIAEYDVNVGLILWLPLAMAEPMFEVLESRLENKDIYLEQKNVLITNTRAYVKFTFTSNSYAVGFVNKFGLNISLDRLKSQISGTQHAVETMVKLEKDLNNGQYTTGDGRLATEESQPEEETAIS